MMAARLALKAATCCIHSPLVFAGLSVPPGSGDSECTMDSGMFHPRSTDSASASKLQPSTRVDASAGAIGVDSASAAISP